MANKFPIGQSLQRLNNEPLDSTSVFNTMAQAKEYAKNNPTAYRGQIIHVKDARNEEEIIDNVKAYEKTCYINSDKDVKPICSITDKIIDIFFDIMCDMLTNPSNVTKEKLDYLHSLIKDGENSNEYPGGYPEYSEGDIEGIDPDNPDEPDEPDEPELPNEPVDYKKEPWNPAGYNEYQIAIRTTQETADVNIGSLATVNIVGASYEVENINITVDREERYYKVITLDKLPTRVSFYAGIFLQEVVHMCNTSEITYMKQMFASCTQLTHVNTDGWDTSKINDMTRMFSHCTDIVSLDLSSWDVSNVTNMEHMFSECRSLTTLKGLNNWNVSKVTNMQNMFTWNDKLEKLNLDNWNVSNVTNMYQMFYADSLLKELSIKKWNISITIQYTLEMFKDCNSLELSNIDMTNCTDYTITRITEEYNLK